jgi:hypothetical protein
MKNYNEDPFAGFDEMVKNSDDPYYQEQNQFYNQSNNFNQNNKKFSKESFFGKILQVASIGILYLILGILIIKVVIPKKIEQRTDQTIKQEYKVSNNVTSIRTEITRVKPANTRKITTIYDPLGVKAKRTQKLLDNNVENNEVSSEEYRTETPLITPDTPLEIIKYAKENQRIDKEAEQEYKRTYIDPFEVNQEDTEEEQLIDVINYIKNLNIIYSDPDQKTQVVASLVKTNETDCKGFARVTFDLLNKTNLVHRLVTQNTLFKQDQGHIYNEVYLNGKWQTLDMTSTNLEEYTINIKDHESLYTYFEYINTLKKLPMTETRTVGIRKNKVIKKHNASQTIFEYRTENPTEEMLVGNMELLDMNLNENQKN